LGGDTNNNSQSYSFAPVTGAIFAGNDNGTFDNGSRGIYWVQNPDVLTPTGVGAVAALSYTGGLGGTAAVQYDGSAGGGKVVYFGFPFETITGVATRTAYMADVLRFFSKPPKFESVALAADGRPKLTLSGEPGLVYTVLVSSNLTTWSALTNVVITAEMAEFADETAAGEAQRYYRARLVP
jgi:hypothetical protein